MFNLLLELGGGVQLLLRIIQTLLLYQNSKSEISLEKFLTVFTKEDKITLHNFFKNNNKNEIKEYVQIIQKLIEISKVSCKKESNEKKKEIIEKFTENCLEFIPFTPSPA